MLSELLEESYYRIVAKLAYQCWRMLPPWARAHQDVEDLIAEGIANLVQVCHKYDPQRAPSPSTYVWMVTRDHFRDLAARYQRQSRAAETTALDTLEATRKAVVVCTDIALSEIINLLENCTDLQSEENRQNARVLAFILGASDRELRSLCNRTSVDDLAASESVQKIRETFARYHIAREDVDMFRRNVIQ